MKECEFNKCNEENGKVRVYIDYYYKEKIV